MMKASNRITLSIISAVGLLNILLIPFTGGGLIPDDFEPQFFEMIDNFSDAADYFGTTQFVLVCLLPLFILISNIFMLIAALVGKKGLCVAAGTVGIGLWFVPFIISFIDASDYGVEFDDFLETLFDSDHGMMAIGIWIALILFVVFIIISGVADAAAKYQAPATGYQQYNPYNYQNNYQNPYQNPYQNNQGGYQAPNQDAYNNPNPDSYTNNNTDTYATPETNTYTPETTSVPETYSDISSNTTVNAEEVVDTDATVNVNAESKFCPECGTKAKAEAVFCGSCGHKF